jgi:hypothetical protein
VSQSQYVIASSKQIVTWVKADARGYQSTTRCFIGPIEEKMR